MIKNTAQIFYTVHVGSKAYFGKTTIARQQEGRDAKSSPASSLYKEGEEYSNQKIDKSRTRLLNLHLFSAVNFNPDLESAAREIPIDLNVREGRQHDISIGGGYSTQDDFGGQVQWNDYNWFGDGRQMSVSVRYASINSYASASLRQPYFLGDAQPRSRDNRRRCSRKTSRPSPSTRNRSCRKLTWHFTEQLSGTLGYRLMYADLNSVSSTVVERCTVFAAKAS